MGCVNPLRVQASTLLRLFNRFSLLKLMAMVAIWVRGPVDADGQVPVLEFLQPTNGAVFSTLDEIPIMLRAVASNDVFFTADVFANQWKKIGSLSYCCTFCPCYRPQEGQETILQIPVPWEEGRPPTRPWEGWTNVQAGMYRLTAQATGQNSTTISAGPVTITVLDRTLRIFVRPDGTVQLVIPQGSISPGSYDLEASADLKTWTRLGKFAPGDVAAFYSDVPAESARQKRFYRSMYVPPQGQ